MEGEDRECSTSNREGGGSSWDVYGGETMPGKVAGQREGGEEGSRVEGGRGRQGRGRDGRAWRRKTGDGV